MPFTPPTRAGSRRGWDLRLCRLGSSATNSCSLVEISVCKSSAVLTTTRASAEPVIVASFYSCGSHYPPSLTRKAPWTSSLLGLHELLVGDAGHEEVVFLLAKGVLPLSVLVDEVGAAGRRRAVLVGEPQRDSHDETTAGAQPLHRLYVVDDLAIICEPLVLLEPLVPGEHAPGLGIQVIVGVVPVLHSCGLVVVLRRLLYLGFCLLGTLA